MDGTGKSSLTAWLSWQRRGRYLVYQRILIAFAVAFVVMFVAYVLLMGKP